MSENGKISAPSHASLDRLERRHVLAGLGATMLLSCAPAIGARPTARFSLAHLESYHGGRLGIAAFNSANGRRAIWRGGERFAYCSTFKLFLAASTLQRVAAGKERLERTIAVRQADMLAHAPVTEQAVGGTLSIGELARAAVEVSDNPAANLLIREMGGLANWRAWYRAIGDRRTRVDRLETALNDVGPGDPRDTAVPLQTLANLERLFETRMLSAEHRTMLLKWMIDSPTGPNRIKAAVPAGTIVAHKTGTAVSHTNDIGLLWRPGAAARPTYIAAYYTGSPLPTVAKREAVLAAAVRAALGSVAT